MPCILSHQAPAHDSAHNNVYFLSAIAAGAAV